MASVDTALLEIERILTDLGRQAPAGGDKRAHLVVEARRRVIEQLGVMLQAANDDAAFAAKPELGKDFRARLTDLRQKLAALQAKWRVVNLTDDFANYAIESKPVAEACFDFINWAKVARRAA